MYEYSDQKMHSWNQDARWIHIDVIENILFYEITYFEFPTLKHAW